MGVEHFHFGFGVVEFVLGGDGILNGLELDKPVALFLEVDGLAHVAEVGEDVVEVFVGEDFGDGADEEHFAGIVFLEELLEVGVGDHGFGFESGLHFLLLVGFLEFSKFLALPCQFQKLLVNGGE
jgi:hypothetical protein